MAYLVLKPFLMLANRQSVKAAFRDYEGDKEGFYEKFKSLNLALELKCIKLELVRASPQESLNSSFSSDPATAKPSTAPVFQTPPKLPHSAPPAKPTLTNPPPMKPSKKAKLCKLP